jgi:hypothetical protein
VDQVRDTKVGHITAPSSETCISHLGRVDHHNRSVGKHAFGNSGKKRHWALFTHDPSKCVVAVMERAQLTVACINLKTSRQQSGRP